MFINEGLESNLSHSASLQRICRLECCTLWLEELVTLFNKTKLILKPMIWSEYFHLGSVVAYEQKVHGLTPTDIESWGE